MSNLIIDEGNTLCKAFVFEGDAIVAQESAPELSGSQLINLAKKYYIDKIISSSTRRTQFPVPEELRHISHIKLDSLTPLPITIDYLTPETLGHDRIAAAVGAWRRFPNTDVLIIDVGTAITIDFIDKNGRYLGGNISLGMRSRFRALNEFTGLLPFISPDAEFPPVGVTTTGAMSAGVVFGLMFEVEGYIKRYPQHTVIFTGGDAFYFAHKIKNTVFATQDLVLQGLAFIADYYKKQDEN